MEYVGSERLFGGCGCGAGRCGEREMGELEGCELAGACRQRGIDMYGLTFHSAGPK